MLRVIFAFALISTSTAVAHPMGNFSISHYACIQVSAESSSLTYVLDFAEIPTFELLQRWAIDGKNSSALQAKATNEAQSWLNNLQITADGQPIPVAPGVVQATIQDGAGGMPILRVSTVAKLALPPGLIKYEDRNYPGRTGWKEVVIKSGKAAEILSASGSEKDLSAGLTAYPADLSITPPQDLTASLNWRRVLAVADKRSDLTRPKRDSPPPANAWNGASAANQSSHEEKQTATPALPSPRQFSAQQPIAPGTVVKGDFLSRMLQNREIGLWLMLAGIGVAFGLGAVHALSPGHGKTLVAAYLVGSRGTVKHAVFLGATVTITHTLSVFLLGLGVLFFEQYVVPDRIIPWLGAISGLSIVGIGLSLLYQRSKALLASGHQHIHSHSHDHHHHHEGEGVAVHVHSHAVAHAHHHEHDHGHDHDHHHSHDHDHLHQDSHATHLHSHDGLPAHSHIPDGKITLGSLIGLGISGGLVPCPSALVLMLSAIALGRAGLGLILLVGFSAGLAIVLMAIGAAVIYAKHLLPDRSRLAAHPFFRLVPVFSAVIVVIIGLGMTAVSLGWVQFGRTLI